jgi:hypothetical protein
VSIRFVASEVRDGVVLGTRPTVSFAPTEPPAEAVSKSRPLWIVPEDRSRTAGRPSLKGSPHPRAAAGLGLCRASSRFVLNSHVTPTPFIRFNA